MEIKIQGTNKSHNGNVRTHFTANGVPFIALVYGPEFDLAPRLFQFGKPGDSCQTTREVQNDVVLAAFLAMA